jgi:hypothetical protein
MHAYLTGTGHGHGTNVFAVIVAGDGQMRCEVQCNPLVHPVLEANWSFLVIQQRVEGFMFGLK